MDRTLGDVSVNLLAIRDVTSIANMLSVFAIFFILPYFSHSNNNFEA